MNTKWEKVDARTERKAVPGGWLYRTHLIYLKWGTISRMWAVPNRDTI